MSKTLNAANAFSERNMLADFLESFRDPEAASAKLRRIQLISIFVGLAALIFGAYSYFAHGPGIESHLAGFFGGLAIGSSFAPAMGAKTTPLFFRYLDAEQVRQRLAELESEEGDSSS